MKFIIAAVLVVASLAAAEPPRYRSFARQTAAPAESSPYNPRGWRPQGAAFNLPKSQPQQAYGPPSPAPSYGPPPAEPTTNDYSIGESTEPPQVGKITTNSKATTSQTSAAAQQAPGSYYVVVPRSTVVLQEPQSQQLVYAVREVQNSAPLVTVPRAAIVQPQSQKLVYVYTEVQKSAPLVTVPQPAFLEAPLPSAQLQALPTFKAVYSPLTGEYVIYSS